jgi:hypothetical protein
LLLKALMRPGIVVIRNVLLEHTSEMTLAENQQVVKALLADGANPAFGNGRIAKDKFCISRWVALPKSTPGKKVSAAKGADYPGSLEEPGNQEKHDEPSQPPVEDPTTGEGGSRRLAALGQSLSGCVELGKLSAQAENE